MFSSKRGKKANDVACIFVHAGAGFHSIQNERVHLQACNEAAKSAMLVLRGGGSAVDAVEIAVKVLEDREITNAGYGSNLAIDGVVECDAVVVDHYARSGGAGAVAQIKNPISLARMLLDHTTQTLSLRRVPPNLLVGQGATNFAYEHGMSVLPIDCLISPAARERWRRWRDDLDKAERNKRREETGQYVFSPPPSQTPSQTDLVQYYDYQDKQEQMREAHTQAMRVGVWNEAQPISPPLSDSREVRDDSSSSPSRSLESTSMSISMSEDADDTTNTTPDPQDECIDPYGPPYACESASMNPFANSTQKMPTLHSMFRSRTGNNDGGHLFEHQYGSDMDLADAGEVEQAPTINMNRPSQRQSWHDGSSGSDSDSTTVALNLGSQRRGEQHLDRGGLEDATLFPLSETPPEKEESPTPTTLTPRSHVQNAQPLPPDPSLPNNGWQQGVDVITDTVGAIAIDLYGNIACGASSGGIGMKHRGRIGPAALVGIGASVIPVDPDDGDRTTVATVTSGTGEHMGTTMAANVCSERVYQNIRKVPGGGYEECGDDEAIYSFIQRDFMGHPSVKASHSTGAIGVLSVKKTKNGTYLYYGHNTDSFALASMHSDDSSPTCTMSRSKGNGIIAQGGRAIRNKKRKS